jgi:hypothetical protein
MLLCFLAACFSAGSTYTLFEENNSSAANFTYRTNYPEVHTPRTWICLTTSGGKMLSILRSIVGEFLINYCAGLNVTGGNIEKKWCGETCDSGGGSGAKDLALGSFGALLAIVLFGSNFIPVKKYNTGDGESKVRFWDSVPPPKH